MKKAVLIVLPLWLVMAVFTDPAYAYLDLSSGSMLLQVLLGGIAGVTVLLKLYWHRFLTLLGVRKKDNSASEGENLQLHPPVPDTNERQP